MKDVQATGGAFSPQQTITSSTSKHKISALFSYFFGSILPSWIQIRPTKINANPCGWEDPHHWADSLKVLTNENRGGLNLVSFDRSPFKLFSLRFSSKSVQAPSCERPKTAQRTLFLLFANNTCIPISASCRAPTNFPHHTLICNNGIAHPPRYFR